MKSILAIIIVSASMNSAGADSEKCHRCMVCPQWPNVQINIVPQQRCCPVSDYRCQQCPGCQCCPPTPVRNIVRGAVGVTAGVVRGTVREIRDIRCRVHRRIYHGGCCH